MIDAGKIMDYELGRYVRNFIKDNEIECEEDIFQSDRLMEQQSEFMNECFKIINQTEGK